MLDNVLSVGWAAAPARALLPERRTFYSILDCFDMGVLLLGDNAEIVYANGAMRDLENLGVFRLGPRTLAFSNRHASETFALRLASLRDFKAEALPFVARDANGSQSLVLRLIASDGFAPSAGRSGAVVLAIDPGTRTVCDRRLFEIALGLSRAEARVAAALLEGLDAKQVAARLHVSHETVRTHLKRIFEKTRTRRQAELLLVLLQVARVGVFPFDDSKAPIV
jgi:DNA-binding CsgD family transcriptional regulator